MTVVAEVGPLRGLPESLARAGRCLVMGVLNVTPDSFSDGGRWLDAGLAIEHGLAMAAQGADLVDVGGESTRPGAERVTDDEEQRRVLPVVRALVRAGVAVSIDTMRASTAQAAIGAGALLVNDVSGGIADAAMAPLVASSGLPYVAMHWRGHSAAMHNRAVYDDIVRDVVDELRLRLAALVDAGIDERSHIVDPGIGFAKDAAHNWALLAHLDALTALGRPVLVGASRKRFLGTLLGGEDTPRAVADREDATTALSAVLAGAGAWCVRVHDVQASADAVRVAAALDAVRSPR